MAFNVGGFVGGLFDGFKAGQDIIKARNDLQLQSMNFEAADAAKKEMEKGDNANIIARALYPEDAIPDPVATTGSSRMPAEARAPEDQQSNISSFDPSQNGTGHVAPKAERIAYYTELANKLGLNPNAIIMTIDKEGLHKYVGDNGHSFGDFQLYTGGGMGNQALNAGINVRDPNTWRQQAEFAMGQMAAHKGDATWFSGQWHGPRDFAPWAVNNFSNPDATPKSGGYVPTAVKPSALGDLTAVPAVPDYSGAMGEPSTGSQMSPSGMGTGLAPPTGALPQSALSRAPTGVSTAPAPPPPPMTAPGAPTKVITVPPRSTITSPAASNPSGLPRRASIGPDGMPRLPADATREEMDAVYDYIDAKKSRSAPARQSSSALF